MKKVEKKLYNQIKENLDKGVVTFIVSETLEFSEKTTALLFSKKYNGVVSTSELQGIELTLEGLNLLKDEVKINFIVYSQDPFSYIKNILSKKVRDFFGQISEHKNVSVSYLI